MPNPIPCSTRRGRIRVWPAGVLLLSAVLLGCGGGGGGTAAPATPKVKNGIWSGTITLQGGKKYVALAAVLADGDSTGTVRLVSIDDGLTAPPYQVTGAFTLADGAVTSNGNMTAFAPAGVSFGASGTTTCTLAGTLANDALTGTLSSPAFNATFSLAPETPTAVSLNDAAGTYVTSYPLLSDGNDASVKLLADGTFSGKSFPAGSFANGATPSPATAIGRIDNGTVQLVSGSRNLARIDATLLGSAASSVQSGYSGLAVFDKFKQGNVVVVMTDNGSSSFSGVFLKR